MSFHKTWKEAWDIAVGHGVKADLISHAWVHLADNMKLRMIAVERPFTGAELMSFMDENKIAPCRVVTDAVMQNRPIIEYRGEEVELLIARLGDVTTAPIDQKETEKALIRIQEDFLVTPEQWGSMSVEDKGSFVEGLTEVVSRCSGFSVDYDYSFHDIQKLLDKESESEDFKEKLWVNEKNKAEWFLGSVFLILLVSFAEAAKKKSQEQSKKKSTLVTAPRSARLH